jgi:hypothetical protein
VSLKEGFACRIDMIKSWIRMSSQGPGNAHGGKRTASDGGTSLGSEVDCCRKVWGPYKSAISTPQRLEGRDGVTDRAKGAMRAGMAHG